MKTFRNNKGFTLIELMIVVVIIGILAAIAIPNFLKVQNKAKTKACLSNRKVIYDACNKYLMDESDDVSTSATLIATGGNGPWIKEWPDCPVVGTGAYTFAATYDTGNITVSCSEHGSSLKE
jgi:prepilin-type N-terminal cleavage/methylation domain-containing protein